MADDYWEDEGGTRRRVADELEWVSFTNWRDKYMNDHALMRNRAMKIEPCNTCGAGTFFAAGTKCPRCDGSGKVEVKTLLEIMALYGEPLTQKQKMAFDCWLNQNAPLGRRARGKP